VALKFLPAAVERDQARLDRFLNEVKTALKVTHPNVCRVYDIGEVEGQHYLSMEYVDGEDLASLLRRIGRLPQDKAVQIARQLCAGLHAAHEQGILHRDLKPANVMIDGRGRAKITDFGLAGLVEAIDGEDVRAGTPGYMAPEQTVGREVSVKSDLYSLGLVLYELFTGRRAFEARTQQEMRALQEGSSPASPAFHVEGLDPAVERAVLRCLEKEPRDRPASALAVSAALPGGDPLAAALAAGETPSPEMVAGASKAGGMRPAIAVACLVATLAGIFISMLVLPQGALYGLIPFDISSNDLSLRARDILAELGHDDLPAYQALGFHTDDAYLRYILDHDPAPTRWHRLASGRPPAVVFWQRFNPERMQPATFHGFNLTSNDPPQHLPGSVRIQLDTLGRLVRLEAIPHGEPDPAAHPGSFDWSLLFERAGLDYTGFIETAPVKAPPVPCTELRAWRGQGYDDLAETTVQAGVFGGKVTYFDIVGRWDLPGEELSAPEVGSAVRSFDILLVVIAVVSAILLARRNLKMGRSDRRGAFRVALFILVCMLLTWCLGIQLQTVDFAQLHWSPTCAVFGQGPSSPGPGC
jgi:serine/threonine-protein kinase